MNRLKTLRTDFCDLLNYLNDLYAPFALIFFIGLFIFASLAGYHREQHIKRQDQLQKEQALTNQYKLEAEKSLEALTSCIEDNKVKATKLEQIKSILNDQ